MCRKLGFICKDRDHPLPPPFPRMRTYKYKYCRGYNFLPIILILWRHKINILQRLYSDWISNFFYEGCKFLLIIVFWVMKPCSLAGMYQGFCKNSDVYCIYFRGKIRMWEPSTWVIFGIRIRWFWVVCSCRWALPSGTDLPVPLDRQGMSLRAGLGAGKNRMSRCSCR
jgi:hypothetical protein